MLEPVPTCGSGRPADRRAAGRAARPAWRVAFYSHDTQGLGHVRRNSLLAAALVAAFPEVTVLLVSGAREAAALPMPERTRLVTLPGLAKDVDGRYRPRAAGCSLHDLVAARSGLIEDALAAFAPDLLVVDKVARGAFGELDRALVLLRAAYGTRLVLGLREVLDDVMTTRREWRAEGTAEAVLRHYDQVWVYGDRAVFDPAREYSWPEGVRRRVRYTGYLGHGRDELLSARPGAAPAVADTVRGPFVLGLVGGGQDGGRPARAFAEAAYPAGHAGVLVTGPFLPPAEARRLEALAGSRPDLRVLRFVGDVPALARRAAAAVSMGGYNATCELLSAGCPTLLLPRTRPRREQALRAEHLARRGLVDVVPADRVTARAVSAWLARQTGGRRAGTSPEIDLDGLRRLPAMAAALVDPPRQALERREHDHVG